MAQNVWDNFSAGKRKEQADLSTKRNRGAELSAQVPGTGRRAKGASRGSCLVLLFFSMASKPQFLEH